MPALSRRGVLGFSLAGAAMAAFPALAAGGSYEAMLVNCIDPRFTTSSQAYMAGRDLKDKFSHFVIAGGPIGIASLKFADWQKTFWDNLAITVQLHEIKRVVGLTHRDCGAAKLAFGAGAVGEKEMETGSHSEALMMFRKEVNARHPKLSVITGIMDTAGRVDLIG